ncbi:hypothetical protein [Arsenicicoccus dermatophilus]|uniref:hypothetical protein n=1 Tax=Arsenicicoccus dermatophilus TaxID=1076331 RepID=UPI001F4C8D5C|nr:hypothetical protein [Arsenicicoccus dermatophilus]MCH8613463.1 hypothetical protein [Arsenicicoccus dermatophilus]
MKRITETAAPVILDAPKDSPTGRLRIGIISPGWGSSGYYSEKVLRNALEAGVWGKGLHMYMNHPSESERYDRPERDVRDLAAVAVSGAVWDDTFGGPVIEAQAVGRYRDMLTDPTFLDAVGVSIVATGSMTEGEAEGRKGRLITELVECQSVDVVTRAGRGGQVLALLESARGSVAEASTEDMQDQLDRAARAAHSGPGMWVYLRDFDPDRSVAWIAVGSDGGDTRLIEQPYVEQDGVLTLTGAPVDVRAVTTYQPLTPTAVSEAHQTPHHVHPVAPAGTTTHPQEDAMPQIEEARLRQLETDAGRATQLETALTEATKRADAAEAQLVEARRVARTARAGDVIAAVEAEHRVTFTQLERRGLTADLPLTEAGDLDEAALTEAVKTAAVEKAAAGGAGQVRGFGGITPADLTEADYVASIDSALDDITKVI